jgi:hypothetical protein
MAKVSNDPPSKGWSSWRHVKESAGYPWYEWFDGRVWELEQGVDFHCDKARFQRMAHTQARIYRLQPETGYFLRTTSKYGGGTVWLQVCGYNGEPPDPIDVRSTDG